MARSLLFQSFLPVKFWGKAILAAAYLINRTPSSVLKGKTPYEVLYGTSPSYENLRVFGCLAFAHNQKRDGDKFAARSRRCVFLGYPFGKKGWTLFDLDTEELFVSRDVVFVKDSFPLGNNNSDLNNISFFDDNVFDETEHAGGVHGEGIGKDNIVVIEDDTNDGVEVVIEPVIEPVIELVTHDETGAETRTEIGAVTRDETGAVTRNDAVVVKRSETEAAVEAAVPEALGVGLRKKTMPVKLNDYVLNNVSCDIIE